jgi:hypothetical protein
MKGGFAGGRGFRGRGQPSFRSSDPKTFLTALKTKDYDISTPEKAKLLIRTMKSFEDSSRLLLDLTDSKHFGFSLIRNIIEQSDLLSSGGNFAIDLLSFFLQDCFEKPMFRRPRDSILLHISNTPFFLRQLSDYVNNQASADEGTTLCKYVLVSIQSSLELLKNEDIRALTVALHQRGFPEAEKVFQILCRDEDTALSTMERLNSMLGQTKEAPKAVTTAELRPPGGRFENDKVQFREISIIPTIEELLCEDMEFLPLSNGSNSFIEDEEERYLDSMFRLLRFDSLNPIREAMAQDSHASSRNCKTYSGCRVIGVHVAAKEPPCVLLSFDSPPQVLEMMKFDSNSEKIKEFWNKKSLLTFSTVICLRRNQQPFCFATIVVGKPEWLQHESNRPVIGVMCGSDSEMLKLLHDYNPDSHDVENIDCDMVVISSSFFASVNVLKCLQKMHRVPLSEYIVPRNVVATRAARHELVDPLRPGMTDAPAYMPTTISIPRVAGKRFKLTSANFVEKCTQRSSLDESQATALQHALTHRVSLIQGPPGTG